MERRRQVFLLAIQWLVVFVHLPASFGNSNLATGKTDDPQRRKLAAGNQGLISIDCGADQDYFDPVTGIYYQSDTEFVSTGENHEAPSQYRGGDPVFSPWFNNSRSFPQGKKNCYNLKPEQGKNHAFEIRFFFYYGNDDGRNEHPTFDLYIGVNRLATVKKYPELSISYYVPLNNSRHEFLSQSPVFIKHFDLGSSDSRYMVRFQDDIYHRFWETNSSNLVLINTTKSFDIQRSDNLYKLPTEVLQTAVQGKSGSLRFDIPPAGNNQGFYVCFHIAEIETTEQGQLREFNITVNDSVIYGPSTVQYLKPQTLCFPNNSTFPGGAKVFINPTPRSSLPPLVNAWELIKTIPFDNSSPTDSADVDAILAIKNTYKINRESWQGDPCVPKNFSWDGLDCRYSNFSPRIISVNLSSSGLTGDIASSFSDLKMLQSLNLSYNELTGEIPESLGELQNLAILNLRGNNLEGSIPQSLREKAKNGELQLSLDDNPNLCLTDSCRKNKQLRRGVIAAVVSVVGLLFLCGIATYWRMKGKRAETPGKPREDALQRTKKRSTRHEEGGRENHADQEWENSLLHLPNLPSRFTYQDLRSATDNFQIKLGGGGFGSVYEGTLSDGRKVAVKRLDRLGQGKKEFSAEVKTIGSIHHVNLVRLVGFCAENSDRLLVYDYMSNGSLDKWIFKNDPETAFPWKIRKKIILNIAKGLAYLHEECEMRIAHLDIKPQNILLDDNFNAKLSDFGLARLMDRNQSQVITQARGTRGYMAPEWLSGKITEKVDVYSFGVVILEVVCGRRNLDLSQQKEDDIWLLPKVKQKAEEDQLVDLVDRCGEDMQQESEEAVKMLRIAIWCLHNDPERRPSMSIVVKVLEGSMNIEPQFDYCFLTSILVEELEEVALVASIRQSASILSGPR